MADYPYGLSAELDPAQCARLEATPVSLGYGRTHTAADLIVGWAWHVTRLHAEREYIRAEHRDYWNAYDYVAALVIRGMVVRGLDLLDADLRASATQAVERFDDLLRSFTEPDERGVVRRFSPDDADTDGQEWWWGRIPTTGPVREELESWWVRISTPGPVPEELG